MALNSHQLLQELVSLPGPAGEEGPVRLAVEQYAHALGCKTITDPRGNLLISSPGADSVSTNPQIAVLAHLDEIAMIVDRVDEDGQLKVSPLGGYITWKAGEGPVTILGNEQVTGILSFGSIHTSSPYNPTVRARETPISFETARVFTGRTPDDLKALAIGPGTRVVLGLERRKLTVVADYISGPFLDDRADLAAMLLTLEWLAKRKITLPNVVFAATVAEEVGGHGALYLLRRLQPDIGIALEIGPRVPETPIPFDGLPTLWVNDSYSAMRAEDILLVEDCADAIGLSVHRQALSRGGSDASCAASHGLLARLFTLAFLAENSHGYEITHKDSIDNLSLLTTALLIKLSEKGT